MGDAKIDLLLISGNRNYSSWSLRAWFFLRQAGIPFREQRIALDQPGSRDELARNSPSGRVPVLVDGPLRVWDSLAICEYVVERFPAVHGWPDDRSARAVARAVSAEMHSGFSALRPELPMNCRARRTGVTPSAAARADIARVIAIWEDCRARFGQGGPWLFGRLSIADAFFLPIASRFHTYGIPLAGAAAAYAQALLGHPAWLEWLAGARAEREVIAGEERGTPLDA